MHLCGIYGISSYEIKNVLNYYVNNDIMISNIFLGGGFCENMRIRRGEQRH